VFLVNDLYSSLCFLERESRGVIFVEFFQVERNLPWNESDMGIYSAFEVRKGLGLSLGGLWVMWKLATT